MSDARAWRVRGRVQGVGFRWWTSRSAQRLDLVGSVRNDADGSVVVTAWGPAEALLALEHRLNDGPMGSRVDRVEPITPPLGPAPASFEIER